MASELGFAGDPHALITTADAAARLGYRLTPAGKPPHAWYADAPRRRAAAFPLAIRRGLYRLGDLQAWSAAGGFSQTRSGRRPQGEQPPAALARTDRQDGREDGREDGQVIAPRAEIAGRLRLLIDNA